MDNFSYVAFGDTYDIICFLFLLKLQISVVWTPYILFNSLISTDQFAKADWSSKSEEDEYKS